MKKIFAAALLASVAVLSVPAHALTVTFDYMGALDGSGKTSALSGAANQAGQNGQFFVETFDTARGCGLNTPSNLVSISGGSYDLRKGTTSYAAAPAGDSTCFAFGPAQGVAVSAQNPDIVTVDYTKLLGSLPTGSQLNYFGLYYGSIDSYNDLLFYDSFGHLIATITGQSLIDKFKGSSGNQTSDLTNIYVNLFFDEGEDFAKFQFRTTGVAFEMDNLVIGYNVPEPASLALIGAGLAALGLSRRRKQRKA